MRFLQRWFGYARRDEPIHASTKTLPAADAAPCDECGGDLAPSRLSITLDPRGVVLPRPVKAHTCVDCGRAFFPKSVWRRLERDGSIDRCSLHRMRAAAPIAPDDDLRATLPEGARA